MTPQLLLVSFLIMSLAAFWREILSLLLAGAVFLMFLGCIQLFEVFHQ